MSTYPKVYSTFKVFPNAQPGAALQCHEKFQAFNITVTLFLSHTQIGKSI
jgi:hypothetical protein